MFPSISKDVGLDQCEMHLNKRTTPLLLCYVQNVYWKHRILLYCIILLHSKTERINRLKEQIWGSRMHASMLMLLWTLLMSWSMRRIGTWNTDLCSGHGLEMTYDMSLGLMVWNYWLNNRLSGTKFIKKIFIKEFF